MNVVDTPTFLESTEKLSDLVLLPFMYLSYLNINTVYERLTMKLCYQKLDKSLSKIFLHDLKQPYMYKDKKYIQVN